MLDLLRAEPVGSGDTGVAELDCEWRQHSWLRER